MTWQKEELKKAYQLRKILTKSTKQKTMIIIDTNDKPVIKNAALLNTWMEKILLITTKKSLPILVKFVTLKNEKSPGLDNIPSKILAHVGEGLIKYTQHYVYCVKYGRWKLIRKL